MLSSEREDYEKPCAWVTTGRSDFNSGPQHTRSGWMGECMEDGVKALGI